MANMKIRPARWDDEEAIARMWAALVQTHHALDPRLPSAARGGPQEYAARVMERLNDPQTCILVAEGAGEPLAGYALAMIVDMVSDLFIHDACGFIADLYVEPGSRRRGVATALVDQLSVWFQQRGVDYYEWHVAADNAAGLAFWRARGGQPVMVRMRSAIGERSR